MILLGVSDSCKLRQFQALFLSGNELTSNYGVGKWASMTRFTECLERRPTFYNISNILVLMQVYIEVRT